MSHTCTHKATFHEKCCIKYGLFISYLVSWHVLEIHDSTESSAFTSVWCNQSELSSPSRKALHCLQPRPGFFFFFPISSHGVLNKDIKAKWKASLFTGTGALHLFGINALVLSPAKDSKIGKTVARWGKQTANCPSAPPKATTAGRNHECFGFEPKTCQWSN